MRRTTAAAPPAAALTTKAALGLLRDVASALAGPAPFDEMLDAATKAVVHWIDAAFARVWTLDADGTALTLRASAGLYTHLDGGHAHIRVGEFKIGRIAADRAPHLTNDVAHDPAVSDPAWAAREGMTAFAGYPLIVGAEMIGVLGLFARHALGADTLDALGAVADALALGIRRHQAEAALREEGEIIEILHRVGTVIVQEPDLASVVQTVTDAATQTTGAQFGAFFYTVADERGQTYTLYALSGAPASAFEDFPLPRSTPLFGPTLQGSEIVRLADVTADPRYGHNAPHHGMPDGHLPVRSYLGVPVISRQGDVLGGLFFGHERIGAFLERHERIAAGIASQAAIAIDSARLHEAERRLASALQRSMLPRQLPSIAGARIAARYLAAADYAEVGGDWYDCVDREDGSLAITVGDVMGHDTTAAAVMGQLRVAGRVYGSEPRSPAEVLRLTDRFLDRMESDRLATAVHATYRPGNATVTIARAGHLAPLLIEPDGKSRWLDDDVPAGVPLGTGLSAVYEEGSVELPPGWTLLMLTDGLVERRRQGLRDGMSRLQAVVARSAGLHPDALCDRVLAAMTGDERQFDDIAILAVRAGIDRPS